MSSLATFLLFAFVEEGGGRNLVSVNKDSSPTLTIGTSGAAGDDAAAWYLLLLVVLVVVVLVVNE